MRRTIHTGKSLAGFGPALSSLFAVAQPQLRLCSSGASVVALAVLFLFAALSPQVASAADYEKEIEINGNQICIDLSDVTYSGLIGDHLYKGTYPDQTQSVISGATGFNQGIYCPYTTANLTTNGDYWIKIAELSSPNDVYYGKFSWDGSTVTPSPVIPEALESSLYYGTFNTRLITASSSGSRLTPNIGLQYYLDPSEFTFQNTPDSVSINVWKDAAQDTFIGTDTPIILSYVSGTSTRNFTFSKSLDANSTYRVNITFYNRLTGSVVLPRTSITMTIVTDGSNVVSYTVNKVANGLTFPEAEYEECGLTSLSGCLNNSIRFLFIPDATTISQFEATYNSLWEKAPFIYLSQIPDVIDTLFNQNGGTFSIGIDTGLGEFTFFNAAQVAAVPNANTIKNIGAAFLWISLAFMFYRKTLAIHDKTTV